MSRSFVPEPDVTIPAADAPPSEVAEFEFVLGKRQIASMSFLVLTALAAFTGVAYMAGKGSAKPVEIPAPAAAPKPVAQAVPVEVKPQPEAPLFGAPEKDHLYVQVGAVERGFASLMVEGARKLGYGAIAASGSNPNIFRVLVGPFPNQDEYKIAREKLAALGLDTLPRKYEVPAATPAPQAPAPLTTPSEPEVP